MSTAAVRPLRADARRNRERVLTAARAVFAEQGREAQMDDVARHAEVGVGTVYRHFPTKEALIEAVAIDSFERVTAKAQEALELDDPWEAFTSTLWSGARDPRRRPRAVGADGADPRADAEGRCRSSRSSTRR